MKNRYYDIIEEYYRPLAEKFGLKLVYLEQRDYREGNPFLLVGKDFVLRFFKIDRPQVAALRAFSKRAYQTMMRQSQRAARRSRKKVHK
mgnify:CR=1 FL=1